MHTSRADLPPQALGDYGSSEEVRAGDAYSLPPGHFVQTLEPVELVEFSPRAEHDRTMAVVARNLGSVPA